MPAAVSADKVNMESGFQVSATKQKHPSMFMTKKAIDKSGTVLYITKTNHSVHTRYVQLSPSWYDRTSQVKECLWTNLWSFQVTSTIYNKPSLIYIYIKLYVYSRHSGNQILDLLSCNVNFQTHCHSHLAHPFRRLLPHSYTVIINDRLIIKGRSSQCWGNLALELSKKIVKTLNLGLQSLLCHWLSISLKSIPYVLEKKTWSKFGLYKYVSRLG